jgi:hypothetical protein
MTDRVDFAQRSGLVCPEGVHEVSTKILREQMPIDFTGLMVETSACIACNIDGLSEKDGHFLVFECKHGEDYGTGQTLMLNNLAGVPKVTVLVLLCGWLKPNEKNCRPFNPRVVRAVIHTPGMRVFPRPELTLTEGRITSLQDMRARYELWLQVPSLPPRVFTCSADEFERDYLSLLPQHRQQLLMQRVRTAYDPETEQPGGMSLENRGKI